MKGMIISKGKYGATQTYARWLSEVLHLPVSLPEEVGPKEVALFDYLVLGSSVYIGKLQLRAWIHKYQDQLSGKKIFLYIVCGTPADEKEKIDKIVKDNIPASLHGQLEYFVMPGRLVYKKLSLADKWLLRMGAMFAANKNERSRMQQDYDAVQRGNVEPIVEAVETFKAVRSLANY